MSQIENCLFCKIVSGDIPADIVYETQETIVFKDINPQAPTHLLVIPKRHVESISETEDSQIFAAVLETVKNVTAKLKLSDYRVAINNGAGAGQTVFHLHAHILAGRSLQWPPG